MKIQIVRGATVFVVAMLLLTGCTAQSTVVAGAVLEATAQPSPLPVPSATPVVAPTPTVNQPPQIAANVQIAGVDVSDLAVQDAIDRLMSAFAPMYEPIVVQVNAITTTITTTIAPQDVGLQIPYEQMVAEALVAPSGARLPLHASYDDARIQSALQTLAAQVATPPSFDVVVATNPISRSFTVVPGRRLDTATGAQLIGTSLRTLGSTRAISLTLIPDTTDGRPTPQQLQAQIEAAASNWKGVVGMYVYDLRQGTVVAQLNQDTVFSGASVMKVPIMLQTYLELPQFTAKQEGWLQKMIIESDNWSANQLLAASVGGSDVLAALKGAEAMTAMLEGLGLQHTYQYSPYQSQDFLLKRNVRIKTGPAYEGAKPYTEADRRLRTTPAEMSSIFLMIDQCSKNTGALLTTFPDQLTQARCQEMLDRLRRNADTKRMVSGFPTGTDVAHKSGWIDDMQGDVGLIHSPGGDFLLAVYVYQTKSFADSSRATPALGQLARLVYTYYNPIAR